MTAVRLEMLLWVVTPCIPIGLPTFRAKTVFIFGAVAFSSERKDNMFLRSFGIHGLHGVTTQNSNFVNVRTVSVNKASLNKNRYWKIGKFPAGHMKFSKVLPMCDNALFIRHTLPQPMNTWAASALFASRFGRKRNLVIGSSRHQKSLIGFDILAFVPLTAYLPARIPRNEHIKEVTIWRRRPCVIFRRVFL
jgi:hypothetical protein